MKHIDKWQSIALLRVVLESDRCQERWKLLNKNEGVLYNKINTNNVRTELRFKMFNTQHHAILLCFNQDLYFTTPRVGKNY